MTTNALNPLPHLGFRKKAPCDSLAAHIECYWFINTHCTTQTGHREMLYPNGGMGIVLNYGDALFLNDRINPPAPFLDGTNTKATRLGLTGRINAIGIRFKPAGAFAFFPVPLREVKNKRALCTEISLAVLTQLYETLPARKTDRDKADALNATMLSILKQDRPVSKAVMQSMALIRNHKGMLPIREVAGKLEINQRKLERLFNLYIGSSAYEFSKSVRVAHARTHLKKDELSLCDLAQELGFYDQSHFTCQFKSVVGMTPGEYKRRAMRGRAAQ